MATSVLPPPTNIRITTIPQLNNEEQVWICPTDSNIIIANWRDFRLGFRQVGVGRSTDGGLTWTDSLISFANQVFFGDSWQSDPTMTVDRLGNFYMSVLDWDVNGVTGGSYIAFYKSTDKGVSWLGPYVHLSAINTTVFEDKQFITVDRTGGIYDGNLYCTWARFPASGGGPNRMAFVRSIDGGFTFEDTIIVAPPQSSTGCGGPLSAGQFPIPLVNSNGDVHVFWLGIVLDSGVVCSGYDGIKHVVSTDGGQTFGAEDAVLEVSGWSSATNGTNIYSNPVTDADISGGPFDGNIYMAFTNRGTEDFGRTDVDFLRSTDNAVSWSSRLQINDDVNSYLNESYHPWLVVNDEGIVIVIFYDTRFDSPSYLLFDLMAAYSFDGGETFTTNHRISNVSSNASDLKTITQRNWPVEYDEDGNITPSVFAPRAGLIGEYIGVTSFHDKINAVWTDSRDGNSEVYTANWYLPILEPRLNFPADSTYANTEPQFSWSTAWKHDQDRYRFEISEDSGFTVGVTTIITDTNSATLGMSLTDGYYYWRVKSLMTTGLDSSEYSETRVLIIDKTPPAQAQLLLPLDKANINNPMPTFDWSDVNKAAIIYDLHISIDSSFPVGPLTEVYSNIMVSEFTPVDLLAEDTTSYWKVTARDPAGNETTSEVFSVTYKNFLCGDANNDATGPNILDLNFLVNYLFRAGPIPAIPEAADLNGSGGNPNILDLNLIVNYIFRAGPLPTCGA